MIAGVVLKFYPWKVKLSLMRLLISETSKVLFNPPIYNFSLTVYLLMICGAHFKLSTRHFEKFLPKIANKYWTRIANDGLGNAMYFDDCFNKFFSHNFGYIWTSQSNEVC